MQDVCTGPGTSQDLEPHTKATSPREDMRWAAFIRPQISPSSSVYTESEKVKLALEKKTFYGLVPSLLSPALPSLFPSSLLFDPRSPQTLLTLNQSKVLLIPIPCFTLCS